MTQEPEDEISETERRALQALKMERVPPREMEDRVVAALNARGLLGSSRPARRALRAAAALAASVLIFLAGAIIGARFGTTPSPSPAPASGERFVLFLYEGDDFLPAPSGGEMERVHEYVEWAGQVQQSGHRVSGEKLKEGVQVLGRPVPPALEDGPAPDGGRGTLSGYFVIDARDAEEIRNIASTCPHLRYGGRIVIRQIDAV